MWNLSPPSQYPLLDQTDHTRDRYLSWYTYIMFWGVRSAWCAVFLLYLACSDKKRELYLPLRIYVDDEPVF